MRTNVETAHRIARRWQLSSTVISLIAAVIGPAQSWVILDAVIAAAVGLAAAALTVSAIWLGLLFPECADRARRGSSAGGSVLLTEISRPLIAGGLVLLAALAIVVGRAILSSVPVIAGYEHLAVRFNSAVVYVLAAAAGYSIILALGPTSHVIELVGRREQEVDQTPEFLREASNTDTPPVPWA